MKTEFNYYKSQLARLNPNSELFNIKITDFEGNGTNWMTLNIESIEAILEFLTQIKKD